MSAIAVTNHSYNIASFLAPSINRAQGAQLRWRHPTLKKTNPNLWDWRPSKTWLTQKNGWKAPLAVHQVDQFDSRIVPDYDLSLSGHSFMCRGNKKIHIKHCLNCFFLLPSLLNNLLPILHTKVQPRILWDLPFRQSPGTGQTLGTGTTSPGIRTEQSACVPWVPHLSSVWGQKGI